MAITENNYTGNGSKVTFDITFEYLKESDIKVSIDGTDQATTAYSFTSITTITFNTAPTNGAAVRIYRDTNIDSLRNEFFAGSAIRAQDLNEDFKQTLFVVQELDNNTWDNETNTIHSDEPWVSSDDQIATTAALDARFQDEANETITSSETWVADDDHIATTQAIENRIDDVITNDIGGSDGISITDDGDGTITVGISANSVDFDRIKNDDIITYTEQNAGSASPADSNVFTALAAARRFDTLVQTSTPSGSDWEVGKTWFQNDADKTVSIWNGSSWEGVVSGGTFTKLDKVIYVDSVNGLDTNDGHRISTPKKTIGAALDDINSDSIYGDGATILVSPGVYQETAPLDIQKKDVSIIGASIRNVIVHPTSATETNSLFRVNSGTYLQNMTFTGVKASGTRGDTGSLWEDATYGLPPTQGWNVSFYPDAMIYKSPYIQNCTNFSDSEIDNDNLEFFAGTEDKGRAGDLDSAPTGGGLLVDGSTVHDDSPLRSMVADSYTHVGLDGPGIFVTNNGYTQITSSYAFFNHFHIACINGGQANLAASTTDFGRYSLIADGKSVDAVITASINGTPSQNDITFDIDNVTAGTNWHGSATRPQDNMLVVVDGVTYPVISATAITGGWRVTISRPDTSDRTVNLGLSAAIADDTAVSFYLRSMIASSGHTMEYVGSGTDYTALPENGGVPNNDNQQVELNNGKIWTAITDHRGTFKVGDTFEVNQQTGFVNIPAGALSVSKLLENLDVNGNEIVSSSNGNIVVNPNGTGTIQLSADTAVTGDISVTGTVDGRDVSSDGTKVDDLITLTGVAGNTTDLGTFTGETLTDNITIKSALQELETAIEGHIPVLVDVHNNTGSTITKGQAVYVSGTHTSGKPTVALADSNGTNTYPAIGLANEDISDGVEGFVVISGYLDLVDTSLYSAGDALYLSETAGDVTTSRPSAATSEVQKLGIVTRSHATNGSILVIGAGRTNDVPNQITTNSDFTVNADIIVTGTVDGRDVATDGTKLDGIETGATADQTASEILTAIKTVDGSGSGLDADLLDGQQGSYYLDYNNFSNTPTIPTTTDNLTEGTTNLYSQWDDVTGGINYASGNVGIGLTPTAKFHVAGTIQSSVGSHTAQMYSDGGASFFTSVGAYPSVFYTNGSERLRIDSSGRVGIGNSSPTQELCVRSTAGTESDILIEGDNGASGGLTVFHNASDCGLWNSSNTSMKFATNGTERARLDSSGRLLVNTSSSSVSTALVVQGNSTGSASGQIYVQRDNDTPTSGNKLADFNFADSSGNRGAAISALCDGTWTAGSFHPGALTFNTTADGASSPTTRMTIKNDGKVGIGTAIPSSLLDCEGSSTGDGVGLHLNNTSGSNTILVSTGSAYSFSGVGASTAWLTSAGTKVAIGPYTAGDIQFINGGEKARIDSSGRLLVGASSTVSVAGSSAFIQQHGNKTTCNLALAGYANNLGGPILAFGASRSTTVGTAGTIVSSGDILGDIRFAGDDGTDLNTSAATIRGEVDGTPGANDMPGRLVFSTTADGASSPTERLRISSAGAIGLSGANYGTSGQVLTSNGSASAPTWQTPSGGGGGGGLFDSYAIFQHTTSSGTGGGATSSSTWNTRPINTTAVSQTWASISSNQITLSAGTYSIEWQETIYRSDATQSRFRNVTDSTTAALGLAYRSDGVGGGFGKTTIASSKTFELQHYTQSNDSNGLGNDTSSGEDNVFATIKITKHA